MVTIEAVAVVEPAVVVALRGVTHEYAGPPPFQALTDIDLTVRDGEFLAFVGPSGSGKSTMMNLIGLLDRPSTGDIDIAGVNTTSLSERKRSALRGSHIGFVFQSFHLLPHRSALENVMMTGIYRGESSARRRIHAEEALTRVGLESRMHAPTRQLSGGEKQRVAIARALAGGPTLLLCDEPTGNLDQERTNDILDILTELNDAGTTLIVITHEREVSMRARRVVHLQDGRIYEPATMS